MHILVLNIEAMVSLCDVRVVHSSSCWCFADAAFCVIGLSMHSCFWFVRFSEEWILVVFRLLYFSINAVLKTYLLDLYSYRKYFIFISFKEKKTIVLHILFDCTAPDLFFSLCDMSQPVLFHFKGKFTF